jgi:L,D-transpeptidase ErfK/SrfK
MFQTSIRWLIGMMLIAPVGATTFELTTPDTQVVGHNIRVFAEQEDTLLDIARKFGLGYQDIVGANPDVDVWLPGEGTPVILPTRYILPKGPREGIIINIAELRLYYFPKVKEGEVAKVITHPIGIGREGWATPLGKARITQKKKDPSWTPPESIRKEHEEKGDPLPKVVPPGPENPLGAYAMRLSMPGYLMHGTDKPYGVGLRVSHGCIRLYPEDIEAMFYMTPSRTPVEIQYQPQKAALLDGKLLLESNSPHQDIDHRRANNMTPMVEAILAAQDFLPSTDEWPIVESVVREQQGVVSALGQTHKWVEDLWFLHAGLNAQQSSRVEAALVELDLTDMYLPISAAALEEHLIGPFNSLEEAQLMAKHIEHFSGESIWVVQIDEQNI